MQEILVSLNPAARSERAKAAWRRIERLPNCTMRATTGPGDARAVAEAGVSEGFTTIVAAGGDGTVNEVVNGIAGSDVALGILPVGTMNVFAAELGMPGDLEEAWAIIQAGRTRRVDLVRANQQ